MSDIQKFIDGVHDYIGRALAPFATRLKALEESRPQGGKDGIDGQNGTDGKDGEAGKDGVDGKDGTSVTLEDVAPLIEEAVKLIPVPENGKDGRDGADGKDAPEITIE